MNKGRIELPTTFLGRMMFGIVSLLLGTVSIASVAGLTFRAAPPATIEGKVASAIAGLLFTALSGFSVLGLVWAITVARWVDDLFQKVALRVMIWLLALCLFGLPFVFWAFFMV